jgi:hypothetical protein
MAPRLAHHEGAVSVCQYSVTFEAAEPEKNKLVKVEVRAQRAERDLEAALRFFAAELCAKRCSGRRSRWKTISVGSSQLPDRSLGQPDPGTSVRVASGRGMSRDVLVRQTMRARWRGQKVQRE